MTCRFRSLLAGVALLAPPLLFSATAQAADLPAIKASADNQVAACATPGRLNAYLKQRNTALPEKFEVVGAEYMRHGEAHGVRWDYAFFQMLLETGYLTYKGDVKPDQNNFAGLGATGKGARGETFPDVSTGVKAHIQHLLMYSGERVEDPVAERTRNIQDWGVLTSWQRGISGPITFSQLAKKWAPSSRRYASDIQTIANRFFEGICNEPDPQPELIAAVGGSSGATAAATATQPAETAVAALPPATTQPSLGLEAQRRAIEAARSEGGTVRTALGGPPPVAGAQQVAAVSTSTATETATATATASPPLTMLNSGAKIDAPAVTPDASAKASSGKTEVAALPGAIKDAGKVESKKAEKKATGACRVWTASYGGAKAIIIKATQDKTTNYTVLDVNEGAEKREADAYINAYAKGGQQVGEFSSQSQALEKAFELCPEG